MEPVAVIGIGCRFPGAPAPADYWRLLVEGREAVRDVPENRWDAERFYSPDPSAPGTLSTRRGGFITGIDRFDNDFFRISAAEARQVDPQQRLLLEVAWEALEDAGLDAVELSGSDTGVFVGIMFNDYGNRVMYGDPGAIGAHSGSGAAFSIAANRISYCLDLCGPSLAVDTACSSSLLSVHLACQSLRNGECSLALAGGANVVLSPSGGIYYTKAGILSRSGRCRSYDADADGFVRGDGAGLVVLKPLSAALADGDTVHAVVRGSAVNHDGRSNGLTAPSRAAQEAMLRAAYRNAGIEPARVRYVEGQGTGLPFGDRLELSALVNVLGKPRPADAPCTVGSVKSNFGHLEGAAGIAALIKTVLVLEHRHIPRSLGIQEPVMPLDGTGLEVAAEPREWPAEEVPGIAGVSAFGFGGTNVHLVVEGPPARRETVAGEAPSAPGLPLVMPLSAHGPDALEELVAAWRRRLAPGGSLAEVPLERLCAAAATRRTHLEERLALLCRSCDELCELLAVAGGSTDDPRIFRGQRRGGRPVPTLMLFAGDDVRAQVAAARRWLDLGIEPRALLGEGCGELAAAVVAGALELELAVEAAAVSRRDPASPVWSELAARWRRPPSGPRLLSAAAAGPVEGQGVSADHWRSVLAGYGTAAAAAKTATPPRGGGAIFHVLGDRRRARAAATPELVALPPAGASAEEDLLSALYAVGHPVAWRRIYSRPVESLDLPSYPWRRSRFWIEAAEPPRVAAAEGGALSRELRRLPEPERLQRLHGWLHQEVSQVLGLETPGQDSYAMPADMGFDSLHAIELKHRIERELGAAPTLGDLLSGRPLEELAAAVDAAAAWAPAGDPRQAASSADPDGEAADLRPLSENQRSLWVLHQVAPESAAYNVGSQVWLRGSLDEEALRCATEWLLGRHSVLTTTYHLVEGRPIQRPRTAPGLDFRRVEMLQASRSAVEEEAAAHHRLPFDLAAGPILRTRLYRRGPDEHLLAVTIHHIACDARSFYLLMRELFTAYEAFRDGRTPALPSPRHDYFEYVRWQRRWLGSAEAERAWDYWRRKLRGPLPVLELPTDGLRPEAQAYSGATREEWIEAPLSRRLQELAKERQVTLFTLLVAVFQVMLHRLSGQDDLLVGVSTEGRPGPELKEVIGHFVNPVVLRTELGGNPVFVDFLELVRRTVLEALEHQRFPFPVLVERLSPPRAASRSPLFQVLFGLQREPWRAGEPLAHVRGLEIEPLPLRQQEGQFDLELEVHPQPEGFRIYLRYDTALFREATAARFAKQYRMLLEAVTLNPSARVRSLTMEAAPGVSEEQLQAASDRLRQTRRRAVPLPSTGEVGT